MPEEATTTNKEQEMAARKRYPTKHWTQEALAAHIGQAVTGATLVTWVRKTTGQTVRQNTVSGVMAEIVQAGGVFSTESGDYRLTRLSMGLYKVEHTVHTDVEPVEQTPSPDANHKGTPLAPGALLEVIHVTRSGVVVAMGEDGTFYRVFVQ